MSIKTRKVNEPGDFYDILEIMKDSGSVCGYPFDVFEEFCNRFSNRLENYYHDFFVIFEATSNKLIGYAYSYNFDLYNSHCDIFITMPRNIECLEDVLNVFSQYLFKEYPLKRMFFESDESSVTQACLSAGFILEATLKKYKFKCGKYSDVDILVKAR